MADGNKYLYPHLETQAHDLIYAIEGPSCHLVAPSQKNETARKEPSELQDMMQVISRSACQGYTGLDWEIPDAGEEVFHRSLVPFTTSRCQHLVLIQSVRDTTQTGDAI